MSLATILSEFWRFIKDNIIKLLIGAVIIAALTVVARVYLNQKVQDAKFQATEDISQQDIDRSYDYLSEVYAQEPAEFEFVVINDIDGSLQSNSFIIDEYLTKKEVVDQVEKETDVEISDTLDAEKNLGFEKTPDYRGAVAAIRDTSTNKMILRVSVGKTPEENEKVAKAYQKIVTDGDLPFMNYQAVMLLSDTVIGENLPIEYQTMVPSATALTGDRLFNSTADVIVVGVVGLIIGLFLSAVVLFVLHLTKRRINYAFDYSWDFDDYQERFKQSAEGFEQAKQFINFSRDDQHVVIAEQDIKEIPIDGTALQGVLMPNTEVIMVIQSGQTTKQWFKKQYGLARLYKAPVKIVHLI
ncbi:MAG: hypothetical protein MR008_05675 [Aerococcus sp.]|nr:hypothetical protein [Aerococcus sp.]